VVVRGHTDEWNYKTQEEEAEEKKVTEIQIEPELG